MTEDPCHPWAIVLHGLDCPMFKLENIWEQRTTSPCRVWKLHRANTPPVLIGTWSIPAIPFQPASLSHSLVIYQARGTEHWAQSGDEYHTCQTQGKLDTTKSVAHDVAPLPNSHSLSLSFPPCSSFKPEGLFEYSLWPIKRGPQNLKKGTKGGPNIK